MSSYLYLPGAAGNYASSPDSAALSITGDIDLRARIQLADWQAAGLADGVVSKWTSSGNLKSYMLYMGTNGLLQIYISADGSTSTTYWSTVANGFAANTVAWIRATWRASDGRIQFFTATDVEGSSWTQLGGDRIQDIGSLDDNASVLEVGSYDAGTNGEFSGRIYRAQIYNGIGGTLVFDADFAAEAPGTTSFTESSVNAATVTINQSGSNYAEIRRVRGQDLLLELSPGVP